MPNTRSTNQRGGSRGSKRGFAAMPKDKQREIAKKGGEHSHGGGRSSGSSRTEEGEE